jgi:hypothetical protein
MVHGGFVMLTCKEVSELASQSLDRQLRLTERIGLRVHLMYCRLCSRYVRQLRFMHKATASIDQHEGSDEGQSKLSTEARNRIRQRLRRQT